MQTPLVLNFVPEEVPQKVNQIIFKVIVLLVGQYQFCRYYKHNQWVARQPCSIVWADYPPLKSTVTGRVLHPGGISLKRCPLPDNSAPRYWESLQFRHYPSDNDPWYVMVLSTSLYGLPSGAIKCTLDVLQGINIPPSISTALRWSTVSVDRPVNYPHNPFVGFLTIVCQKNNYTFWFVFDCIMW